jgi:hypothetical protein
MLSITHHPINCDTTNSQLFAIAGTDIGYGRFNEKREPASTEPFEMLVAPVVASLEKTIENCLGILGRFKLLFEKFTAVELVFICRVFISFKYNISIEFIYHLNF